MSTAGGGGGGIVPVLDAAAVTKTYRTGVVEVPALRAIDLRVERGEMVAVMGPSGSGKTTLLNCLSGLDEIDGGQVLVDGQDVHEMSDAKRTSHRARHMGFPSRPRPSPPRGRRASGPRWRCGLASDRWCRDRSGPQRVRDFRTPVGAAPDSAPAAAGEDRGPPRVEGSRR